MRQPRSFVARTALGAGAALSSAASSGRTWAACWSQATGAWNASRPFGVSRNQVRVGARRADQARTRYAALTGWADYLVEQPFPQDLVPPCPGGEDTRTEHPAG
jgi:hypothetical protein